MGGSSIRHRSHSIGAGDLRTSLLSTLPRPLPPVTAAQAREAPPTDDINNSNESVLMDVSAFIRKSPNRSPSRSRKVQSMFVESNLTTAHIAQNVPESQGIFPYDLPSLSPPPLPKRGSRPKNVAIGNLSTLEDLKPISPPPSAATLEGLPLRRTSQPHIELSNASPSELPSNLDTCSMSSSSSALHPVTLADIERRGPMSPSHLRYSSQLSILSVSRPPTPTNS